MSIIAAFGDDDHTAADGPYARLMKVRKWLYIFAACVIFLDLELYNEKAASNLIKVIEVPSWILKQVFAFGIVYLIIQFALLSLQLFRTYDIILSERLTFRRKDELARATKAISDAQKAHMDHRDAILLTKIQERDAAAARLLPAAAAVQTLRDKLGPQATAKLGEIYPPEIIKKQRNDLRNAQILETSHKNKVREAENEIAILRSPDWRPSDPRGLAIEAEMHQANAAFLAMLNMDPATRPHYRVLEVALDLLRLLPPPIFAVSALISLAVHAP